VVVFILCSNDVKSRLMFSFRSIVTISKGFPIGYIILFCFFYMMIVHVMAMTGKKRAFLMNLLNVHNYITFEIESCFYEILNCMECSGVRSWCQLCSSYNIYSSSEEINDCKSLENDVHTQIHSEVKFSR